MTYQEFYNLCPLGINNYYALALYVQSILETGHFSSNVYQRANNLFGMKVAGSRHQSGLVGSYAAPDGGAYASYVSASASIADRIALDTYNHVEVPDSLTDIPGYYDTVANLGYAGDKSYVSKLLGVLKGFESADLQAVEDAPKRSFLKYLLFFLPAIVVFLIVKRLRKK